MAVRYVRANPASPGEYGSIQAAIIAADAGDTIVIDPSYTAAENAVVTVDALTFQGDSAATGIKLTLASPIYEVRLTGTTAIGVVDPGGGVGKTIYGNAGDNVVTIVGAATAATTPFDVVDLGAGANDRLVLDYSAATEAVQARSDGYVFVNGSGRVNYYNAELFTFISGSANDILASGAGNDILLSGAGDDRVISVGGEDVIDGGDGIDMWYADLSSVGAVNLDFRQQTVTYGAAGRVSNIEVVQLTTGAGDDTIVLRNAPGGTPGFVEDNKLTTGAGNDTVIVTGGATAATTKGFNRVDLGMGAADRLIIDDSAATVDISLPIDFFDNQNRAYNVVYGPAGAGITHVSFFDVDLLTLFTGSGNDNLNGNNTNDIFSTGAGNDTVNGRGGDDVIHGGLGDDTLRGGAGQDTFLYTVGVGNDATDGGADADALVITGTVADDFLFVSARLGMLTGIASGSLANVETVTLDLGAGAGDTLSYASTLQSITVNLAAGTATGFASIMGVENVIGSLFADTLTGDAGSNILDGGGGADTMSGLGGDDFYVVNRDGDVVVEAAGEGFDAVLSSLTDYKLTSDVEILLLQGDAVVGRGNGLNNYLYGTGGINYLDGGAGADVMVGYGGNDTYYVDDAGDLVVEATNEGIDTVYSFISDYSLTANVETLSLQGSAVAGRGNALNNYLFGTDGSNYLEGGAGADYMTGYGGDDVYAVDDAGDAVFEAAGGGIDTIYTSLFETNLADNVEAMMLIGGATVGRGNGLNNYLYGTDGTNYLDGGAGADYMTGFGGDDVYFVDSIGDQVFEAAGGGLDTVYTSVSGYALPANVESVVYVGPGAGAIVGNDAGNVMVALDGGATFTGGAGQDVFVFHGDLGQSRITDFTVGEDVVEFDAGLFGSNASVLAAASDDGHGNVVVQFGDDTLLLAGVSLLALQARAGDILVV